HRLLPRLLVTVLHGGAPRAWSAAVGSREGRRGDRGHLARSQRREPEGGGGPSPRLSLPRGYRLGRGAALRPDPRAGRTRRPGRAATRHRGAGQGRRRPLALRDPQLPGPARSRRRAARRARALTDDGMTETPQNIYDDPEFLAGYATLERFGPGWTRAVEHADFIALLPDVDGKRVLDLGCGLGQLALHLAEQGAAKVVAVDLSELLLPLAPTAPPHPRIPYRREALEHVMSDSERFDLVVSPLALHYVEDYAGLVRRISRWLTPGGVLVYSTEHPIYTAIDPA